MFKMQYYTILNLENAVRSNYLNSNCTYNETNASWNTVL